MFFLRKRLGGIEGRRISVSLMRITLATALMGIAAFAVDMGTGQWLPGAGLAPQLIRLGTTIGAALIVLAASAYLLRVHEFREAVTLVSRKLRIGTR